MSKKVLLTNPFRLNPESESADTLYQLIYTSSTDQEWDKLALTALLLQSRKKNSALGVTGLLLYSHRRFIQVLEGPKDVVDALYQSIQIDHRHKNLVCLTCHQLKRRDFSNWAMGFKRMGEEDFSEALPGFSEIIEAKSFNLDTLSGLSIRVGFILRQFSDSMRLNDLMSHS